MIRTKIICTIGPVSESYEMLKHMAGAGMNIVRLNMSHGDHTWHQKVIRHMPGVRVNLPAITQKDRRDILFGREHDVDFIALSFVREANDIRQLKELLDKKVGKIKIIAKIEDQEGISNLEQIIEEADGVMVARGDLGVEIPVHTVPSVQREIVRKCAERGRRVIVATHLLESMIVNPIPTRAEVTDVANAVYEEADAVMLSGETTVGKYPLHCIE